MFGEVDREKLTRDILYILQGKLHLWLTDMIPLIFKNSQ